MITEKPAAALRPNVMSHDYVASQRESETNRMYTGSALGPAPVHNTGIKLSPLVINKKRLTYN